MKNSSLPDPNSSASNDDPPVSLRDIIAEAGLGRTLVRQDKIIAEFRAIGIRRPADFAGREKQLLQVRSWGARRQAALQRALIAHGLKIASYSSAETPGTPRDRAFVVKRIATLERALAHWKSYAKRKGFDLDQPPL